MIERTVFIEAIDIADATERAAYLDQVCAGDEALRQQVVSLLAAHEREGEFMDAPAVQTAADASEQDFNDGAAASTPQPVSQEFSETQVESA